MQGQSALVEFRTDGTLTSTENGHVKSGTYKFTDSSHMRVDIVESSSNTVSLVCEIAVHGDIADLTMAMAAGDGSQTGKNIAHLRRLK